MEPYERGTVRQTDTVEDRQLLEAFVGRNDQAAFELIVERHARWVFAAAFRQLRDRHLAEDAVQIVFAILARKAPSMNTGQKLSGWLFNTLQFTVKNFRRAERSRNKHQAIAAKPEMQEPPPDSAMVRECAQQIDAAVARLSADHRQAILLRFYRDLPFDRIALEMGTNEAAARKRVDRALKGLRRYLGPAPSSASVLSAAAIHGLDQSPLSLVPAATKAALAPAVSNGARQVLILMSIAKVQIAALVALACLIVGLPAAVITWRALSPTPGPAPSGFASLTAPASMPTIGGIVRNEAGQSLDNVQVHLQWRTSVASKTGGPPQLAFVLREVRTDRNGRWTYSSSLLADASNFRVRLERSNYGADEDAAPIRGALTDQTAEFVLTRGIHVAGSVVNQYGQPILQAEVSTIQDRFVVNDPGKTVNVDASGHFVFPPTTAGTIALTITASGYAPDLQRVEVKEGMSPVRIVLSPGKTIRARIVDQNGQPIVHASYRMIGWRYLESLTIRGMTDGNGQLVVRDAPDDAIEFMIDKDRHQSIVTSLVAGTGETTLTMPVQPTVRGTVTDADTGKPIPRFEIFRGRTFGIGSPPFYDFTQPKIFSNGIYEITVDSQNEAVAYYLRAEAEGYAPSVTPPFLTSSTFNLKLHRSEDLRGRVVGADGNPVAMAHVVLAIPQTDVELMDNDPSPGRMETSVQTDSTGEFRFRPQTGPYQLLALCDSGYAIHAFDKQMKTPTVLTIEPWAKIDANYSSGNPGRKSSRINVSISPCQPYSDNFVQYGFQYLATITGGRMKLDKVPGFDGNLVQLGIFSDLAGGTDEWISMRLIPGQTASPDLRGATVVGSLSSPGNLSPIRTSFVTLKGMIEPPARNWPTDWSAEKRLPLPVYRFEGSSRFKISGVQLGKFHYEALFGEKPLFFRASGILEIHADQVNATVDLGNLVCVPVPPIKVGDEVPDVLGHTLDEAAISRRDFAGKYVLVVLWDTDPRFSKTPLPLLSDLSKQFAGNSRVALVALNLDAIDSEDGPVRPGAIAFPSWINGYVSPWDPSLIYKLVTRRPSVFIIGPDGNLVARDVTPTEIAATLGRLMAPRN
jgi:RNA polymerase sigma factor (sigma-70 family)